MENKLKKLQKDLGIKFSNENLLKEALTHRSYLNENKNWKLSHNERLEFLGDAVLELVVTNFLFGKFKDSDEGKMSGIRAALVNTHMLANIARDMDLEKHIFMSKGESEEKGKAKESLLADVFEAVLGALYLDKGFKSATKFVEKYVIPYVDEVSDEDLYKDAKSRFQESSQNIFKETPKYKVIRETGPDHKKEFEVAVYIGNKKIASGVGPSKQEAEQDAAKNGFYVFEKA